MSAEPLSDIKDKVQYCFGGEHAIGRGIFHLPEQDPLAPPKYVSVRSQQVISLILVVLVFLVNVLAIRVAIFTNDVCEGAGRIFIALMFLSLLTSAIIAKVGYHLGYVLAAAEYLPTEFNVDASA